MSIDSSGILFESDFINPKEPYEIDLPSLEKKTRTYFVPTNITNCHLWLDGGDKSSITHVSGDVSQWNDKSGQNNHAVQTVTPDKPMTNVNTLNSRNVVTFAGSEYLSIPYTAELNPTEFSVFVVVNSSDVEGNTQGVVSNLQNDGDTDGGFDIDIGDVRNVSFRASNGSANSAVIVNANSPPAVDTYYLVNANITGTTPDLFINGIQQTDTETGSINYDSNTPFIIGRMAVSGGDGLQGNIAEVIVYNRKLTPTERQQVEDYLNYKWSIY